MPFGELALALPSVVRGYSGEVRVYHATDDAPEHWGFGVLNLPFPIEWTRRVARLLGFGWGYALNTHPGHSKADLRARQTT
jgi:hypothetical protein